MNDQIAQPVLISKANVKHIEHMLHMQDEMNAIVNPLWREQKFAWHRAAWVECAEMMDHVGWKWWKKQTPNIEQVKLELVDIWHFLLSVEIEVNGKNSQAIANALNQAEDYAIDITMQLAIEELVDSCLNSNITSPIVDFGVCCRLAGLSYDELYKLYIGKNVLNRFRQANGYKDGSYIKMWYGAEDNEYLSDVLSELDVNPNTFEQDILDALQCAYDGILRDAESPLTDVKTV